MDIRGNGKVGGGGVGGRSGGRIGGGGGKIEKSGVASLLRVACWSIAPFTAASFVSLLCVLALPVFVSVNAFSFQ